MLACVSWPVFCLDWPGSYAGLFHGHCFLTLDHLQDRCLSRHRWRAPPPRCCPCRSRVVDTLRPKLHVCGQLQKHTRPKALMDPSLVALVSVGPLLSSASSLFSPTSRLWLTHRLYQSAPSNVAIVSPAFSTCLEYASSEATVQTLSIRQATLNTCNDAFHALCVPGPGRSF